MAHANAQYYTDTLKPLSARSFGTVTAPRGILGHWVVIKNGRIANYQVITPTAWNGSPRDKNEIPGPWEQAIMGTAVRNPEDPVEVEQVVRSFDPCLVCTVHAINLS
jgi:hydrogenase large subunit